MSLVGSVDRRCRMIQWGLHQGSHRWQKKTGPWAGVEAEREGFEPSIELPLYSISSAAPSTTRPPLQRLMGQVRM